ncbi:MAG: 7-carboxy-7-deazaguanine synthase QueE [Myxococcota bacterium]|nr:7-carboxy-7-deazaguanine synthase QueE [Myxococcota bacterium]
MRLGKRGQPDVAKGVMNLVEIFASAQGEGPYVGTSTVFVRLGECDLRCLYCDSPGTWKPAAQWRFETSAGSGKFETFDNPASIDDVAAAVARLAFAEQRFVSVTGGEPLLQPEAVRAIAELVAPTSARFLLETHGLEVEGLEAVVDVVDVVSMDWKSPVEAAYADISKEPNFLSRHKRFLEISHASCEVYVKLVVTPETSPEEVATAAREIASVDPAIPFVLQPVSPFARVRTSPRPSELLPLLAVAQEWVEDVRLIPQTHRAYGAL